MPLSSLIMEKFALIDNTNYAFNEVSRKVIRVSHILNIVKNAYYLFIYSSYILKLQRKNNVHTIVDGTLGLNNTSRKLRKYFLKLMAVSVSLAVICLHITMDGYRC